MGKLFFNKSKELELKINEYLDVVSKSVLIFKRDAINYIRKRMGVFESSISEILEVENTADQYQKDIKYKLYKYMLIPDARADVLELLESIDNIVDLTKKVLVQLSIEKPNIPNSLEDEFQELVNVSVKAVEELVKSVRAYFEEPAMVNEYINKVHFYEHEVDKIEERIKREIFSTDLIEEFSKKVHLRYFTEKIALLSDEAETLSERVSVASIKRSI